MKRHLRLAPQYIKLQPYKSLVRLKLKYESPIWDPRPPYLAHATESLRKRAARFAHSSYSSKVGASGFKAESSLRHLALRRRNTSLSMFHKIFHSPFHATPYTISATRISHCTSHSLQVARPRTRTSTFSALFFPCTAPDWNGLPSDIATITYLSSFIENIIRFFFC